MTPKTELRFPREKTKSDCGAFINEEDYSGYTKLEGLILSAAYVQKGLQWEMAERSPFSLGDSLILKENNKQLRLLSEDEVPKLLDQCPEYLRHIVECALNTGMSVRNSWG